MADDEIKVKRTKLSDYQKNPKNHNKGSVRGAEMIAHSFEEYGAGRSLLADRDGVLIAGNQSIEGAIAAGIEDVIEVRTSGKEIVVVVRDDLDLKSDNRAIELGYIDNRASVVSINFDAAQIAADLERGADLSQMWQPAELNLALGIDPPIVDTGAGGAGDGGSVTIPEQYMIVIECASEQEQAQFLERLMREGLKCRALLS